MGGLLSVYRSVLRKETTKGQESGRNAPEGLKNQETPGTKNQESGMTIQNCISNQ